MPTTIMDGPAGGQGFSLRRAPMFLRLVVDAEGKWDALDQLDDEPREGETVHVYEAVEGSEGAVFACGRGAKVPSGRFEYAIYRHRPDADGVALRDTALWREWAALQACARMGHPLDGGSACLCGENHL